MRFSVIVPTYMEEQWVGLCLQSIVRQEFNRKQFEIVVSDAQSSDDTTRIARQYADHIVTSGVRGIAHGRNLGAAKASGEILVFVDADVQLDGMFLKELDSSFGDAGVVAATGVAIPTNGNIWRKAVYRGTYWLVRFFNLMKIPLYPGLCVGYRKNAFEEVNGFREEFGVVEDLDLSKRISQHGRCVVNRKAVAHVSTRRLEKHLISTVLFHVSSDIRYLVTGKAPRYYPKAEELKSPLDLWRLNLRKSDSPG